MKFEYKTLKIAQGIIYKSKDDPTVNASNPEEFENVLNELGNEGWELVEMIEPKGFLGLGDTGFCIFKRKVD